MSDEERRSTFAHAPGDVDMCANCRRHQQQHFWVCNSCGFERSPGEDGLPSELCEHPESTSCTLVCPLQRIPNQLPIGTSDTWPLSWAPPPDRKDEEEWRRNAREARRRTDRVDAPRVVEWRGHRLERKPDVGWGDFYGFHNVVQYEGPDPFWRTEISCDGNRATIELQEESLHQISGEGANETEALEAAARGVEKFITALRVIVGTKEV